MTAEAVIGHAAAAATDVDWVDIDWPQTVRRALRLCSRAGRRINLLLPREHPTLRHGDVVAAVDGQQVAIWVKPIALLCCTAPDRRTLGRLCAELGNLHVPLEIRESVVITPDDGPAREVIDRLYVCAEQVFHQFHPERFSVMTPLSGLTDIRK